MYLKYLLKIDFKFFFINIGFFYKISNIKRKNIFIL